MVIYKSATYKTKKMKKQEFYNFIGIDVSKKTLDVVFIFNKDLEQCVYKQFTNDIKGIKSIVAYVNKQKQVCISNTLFCFEHTGIYGRLLATMLNEKRFSIWMAMPIAILRSIGLQRGKNDKVDAKRIAIYAMKNNEQAKLWEPPRKQVELLRELLTARERLITNLKGLKVPINEFKQTGNKQLALMVEKSTRNAIKGIEKDIKLIEQAMNELIKNDPELNRLHKMITSVPGIGKITAMELICFTNEFKTYAQAKQLACYCGVAPFEHTSGSSVKGRTRVSKMANRSLKTKLHLCAMSAIQWDEELRDYYKRKVAEGKNKMLVINAVRNKLIHRVTAVVKRQTPFITRNAA